MKSFGKNIYLVRHGETEYNLNQIFMGQSDSPLTERGIAQAHEAARNIGELGIEIMISSDLGRAKATSEIICSQADLKVLRFDPSFRERQLGCLEMMPRAKVLKKYPQYITDKGELILEHDFPEAEKINDFYSRIINGLHNISEEFKGKKVLIVTHKGVLNMIYAYINDVPLEKVRTKYRPDNCVIENY